MLRIQEIIDVLDEWAPSHLAEDWDSVGLQIGDPEWRVSGVVVALDPSEKALRQAALLKAGLLVTHHPLFFTPIKRLITSDLTARLVQFALQNRIAIFSAHTNLDHVFGGVNDCLAERLALQVTGVLQDSPIERMAKLVLYVPPEHADALRRAVFEEGGGIIGNYTGCSFNMQGTGTFSPQKGASPYRGEAGGMEHIREVRVEVLVHRSAIERIIQAAREAHPYEEMAYDAIPVLNPTHRGGMGRVGLLQSPTELRQFARQVAQYLGIDRIRIAGDPGKTIRTAALCAGAGASLLPQALRKGVDVFISGEFTYHQAHEALAHGTALLDTGHFHSERPVLQAIAARIENRFKPALPDFRVAVLQEVDVFFYG